MTPEQRTRLMTALAAERSRTGGNLTADRIATITEAVLLGRTRQRPIHESAPAGAQVRIEGVTDASLREMIAETARKAIAEATRRQTVQRVAEAAETLPATDVAEAWVAGRTGEARHGTWGRVLEGDSLNDLLAREHACLAEADVRAAKHAADAHQTPAGATSTVSEADRMADDLRALLTEAQPIVAANPPARTGSIKETPAQRAGSILDALDGAA